MKNKLLFIIIFFVFTLSYAQYNIDDTQTRSFTDISTTGTEIPLADDGTANITAPWTLYLGSQVSTDLLIGNNGAILFGVTTGSIVAVNDPLTTNTPMIAPFWDDLDTELGGVYYQTITHTFNGTPLYSEFIIQWDRVHYNGSTNTDIASFQVVFKHNIITQGIDKTITFIYNDVDLDGTSYDDGASATIGVATADEVSQYSYNTASLTNVSTIIFSVPTTNIPDDNFEAYLETHNANGNTVALGAADSMGNGIIDDNIVPTSRIENVTSLTISNQNIANLTGIEDFIALTSLDCAFNNLSTLDLSSNIALTSLFCYSNDLSTLNLNNNNHLEILWTFNNSNLTTLHIQNGANHLLAGTFTGGINTYARFRADNNSSLTCIFVDNATDANNGVNDYVDWEIDATATFVQDEAACDALGYEDLVSLGFEIYPNPVKDVLYLRATEKINQIHIYNMLGQEVKRILPSASSIEINLSNLPNGAYFIKAQIGMHNGTYKIIKQ